MARWLTIAPALGVVLALSAAIAACNGDGGNGDDSADQGSEPTSTSQAPDDATESAATAPPEASATAEASSGDREALEEVRDKFIASTFTATYENRGATDVEFVPVRIYKDGDNRYRVDFVGQRDGQPYSGISIIDQGTAYICGTGELARIIGGSDAGACVRDPGGTGNPLEALFSSFSADENQRIVERTERQIAGRTAQCYTTEHTASGERGTLCQDAASGALLAIESADPAGTNIVSTDVTDSVADGDFTPPYELHELPTGQ